MGSGGAGRAVPLDGMAVTPRPLRAYRDMFGLGDSDLAGGPVLDCPAGVSPFGAQVRASGGEVVSVDPAYRMPLAELLARARADLERITAWQRANPDGFDWSYLGSPEQMATEWAAAIELFGADFRLDDTRYRAAALPALPFPDGHFALALSGFLLFVYADRLGFDEHLAHLRELARVTRGEVRVFPLHASTGEPYAPLPELRAALRRHGVRSELRRAACAYAPDPDADLMLVCRSSCW